MLQGIHQSSGLATYMAAKAEMLEGHMRAGRLPPGRKKIGAGRPRVRANIYIYRTSLTLFSLMVRWVVGSILHGVDPLSYFSFQPVLHDWCNKGRGMCYPVCGMVHIKEPLLLIENSSQCGGSVFPLSLSELSFTMSDAI